MFYRALSVAYIIVLLMHFIDDFVATLFCVVAVPVISVLWLVGKGKKRGASNG